MPTAIVADDEENLRIHLVSLLKRVWPELDIIAQCENGEQALHAIGQFQPDIAFLDIKMPGLTGLEVVERAATNTRYVFATAYDEFAVKAFENEALDYLLKPIDRKRLEFTVQRLKKHLQNQTSAPDLAKLLSQLHSASAVNSVQYLRWIRASKGEITHHLDVAQVLFFKSDDKYTEVHTAQGEFLIRRSVTELLAELDPAIFWQINRGVVVNSLCLTATRRDASGNLLAVLRDHPNELAIAKPYQSRFRQM
jgi:DNA-binding LytR/AlgR family response regulator